MNEPYINPQSFLPLTPAAFHILLVLAAGDAHGYALMAEVRRRTVGQVRIGPATMYPTLARLVRQGLIVLGDQQHAHDDPRRRYYQLTDLGDQVVRAETLRLAKLVQLAADILK